MALSPWDKAIIEDAFKEVIEVIGKGKKNSFCKVFVEYEYNLTFGKDSVLDDWLNGKFTKVVVSVDSDEELIALNKALDDTFIPHALITDAGLTEFHGVPTNTCLGIGPYVAEEIDKFTGHLPLL